MNNSLLVIVIGLAMNACTSGHAPMTAPVELKDFPLEIPDYLSAFQSRGGSFREKLC